MPRVLIADYKQEVSTLIVPLDADVRFAPKPKLFQRGRGPVPNEVSQ